jgi:uncharacterized protein (TIGR00725 family)
MSGRLPVVGVLGSGDFEHAAKAEAVGRWLATQSVHLLTGAGKGVMEAVSRAFHAVPGRAGLVVGIVPCGEAPQTPRPGYPNPFVELAILTHLPLSGTSGADPLSRNHINVLSSDVIIALPGGVGTASEVALALRYGRPIAAYVDARTDIPQLPQAVPMLGALAEVQDFVRRSLGKA